MIIFSLIETLTDLQHGYTLEESRISVVSTQPYVLEGTIGPLELQTNNINRKHEVNHDIK